MYGSIRKSYGAKRASRETETTARKVSGFARKNPQKIKRASEYEETSYINVESPVKESKNTRGKVVPHSTEEKNTVMKNEFPIASVILTIVFTMMIMVLAFGIGG